MLDFVKKLFGLSTTPAAPRPEAPYKIEPQLNKIEPQLTTKADEVGQESVPVTAPVEEAPAKKAANKPKAPKVSKATAPAEVKPKTEKATKPKAKKTKE
jgi:hypothetical protein